jgi:superfamily II DNA or RNA helicase
LRSFLDGLPFLSNFYCHPGRAEGSPNGLVPNLIILSGGMRQKQRKNAISQLQNESPRVVLATGRYLGEGFDDDRLDTMFLAMPISWKGTLAQYAGRLNRIRPGKREVIIYDYVDLEVPMLNRVFQRRLRGYRHLGYTINSEEVSALKDLSLFSRL